MNSKILGSLMAVTILAGSGIAIAQSNTATVNSNTSMDARTAAPGVTANVNTTATTNTDVLGAADQSPVVLTGTVTSLEDDDEFVLSYGAGSITVEMEGWEWDDDEIKYLRVGDRVTVTGQIDDDLFEGREIEATNIYVTNSNRTYYRDDADRYPMGTTGYGDANAMTDGSYITMSGRVSNINGDEFMLTNDNTTIQVDVAGLDWDPIETTDTHQRIQEGDMIQVYGEVDEGFFERKEIVANRLVKMMNR